MVNVQVDGEDSWMFQIPATEVSYLQAESAGLPHHVINVSGEPEQEVLELHDGLLPLTKDVDGLVSGALRSEYQRRRIDGICEDLGIRSFSPLWHHDPLKHMRELVECNVEMIMVSVSCDGLDESWLGRTLDEPALEELEMASAEFRFNVDGEGGEFETLVVAGPHLDWSINIEHEVTWDGSRGHIMITSAGLQKSGI